jgi:DNA invertase Pin-like site-specific DNA recombinase
MKEVRCAIYTRKSSEDGLEQDFNSLHAQRDACAAYILSQAGEGWALLPAHYDDGGISGGTLERPALNQLLADVAAGAIDIVVVYKVDRLTRSLLDFAKLVEAFDKADTSFISITQAFNTTTSMGRLTLNMLLSFAQFEREVTAERIRDKIAASKAKGMWMGGIPPLGYRPNERSLAIVEHHADLVRSIVDRYLKAGTVRQVSDQLKREGIVCPVRQTQAGQSYGGKPFSRGQLYYILKNPIYVGDIAHRGTIHPGNHPPIIERAVWEKVQRQLALSVRGERGTREPTRSVLAGRIYDAAGEPLIASHANKTLRAGGGTKHRYRYYVSKALHLKTETEPGSKGMRVPAAEIEQLVVSELANLFAQPMQLATRASLDLHPDALIGMAARAERIAADMSKPEPDLKWLERVIVHEHGLDLVLSATKIAQALQIALPDKAPETFLHHGEGRVTRTGRAVRLVQSDGALAIGAAPDPTVLRLMVKARHWWATLAQGQMDATRLATQEGVTDSYLIRVVRLAFLAPQVVEGILAGRLRSGIDAAALMKPGAIPPDWSEQERRLLVR